MAQELENKLNQLKGIYHNKEFQDMVHDIYRCRNKENGAVVLCMVGEELRSSWLWFDEFTEVFGKDMGEKMVNKRHTYCCKERVYLVAYNQDANKDSYTRKGYEIAF